MPEALPDLGRHLEADELVRPGGEPALPVQLRQVAGDGQQRGGRGLAGEVVEFGAVICGRGLRRVT
jgi:hypothetical protein